MATKAGSAEVPQTADPRTARHGVRRRDFLNVAAVSFAGVGAVAAIAPLLVQMAPSADVLALATTEVDISKVKPGQGIKASWRKQPVFVRNLTPKEIAEANAVPLSRSRDPADTCRADQARAHQLADHAWRLHSPWLRSARHRRRREPRSVRRIFLPVPRLAIRHRCAHSAGTGAQEPRRAGLQLHIADDGLDRRKGVSRTDELFLGKALRTQASR